MGSFDYFPWLVVVCILFSVANGVDVFLEWHVAIDMNIQPMSAYTPVITINGKFPGPLINATTNDNIHVNVFNNMDEPVLMTWNGIQQRLNSWQDGVSGTNCPIQPNNNWTYVFQFKDQIGSFFYFPSTNFQRAGGGFGPIRVNNRNVINVPFPKPEAEFDLLIGDWYEQSYKVVRSTMKTKSVVPYFPPTRFLINGKGPYMDLDAKSYESFTVTPDLEGAKCNFPIMTKLNPYFDNVVREGKTYRFRISNVGIAWSFNFMIQNHKMVLVETEGSYTNQITLDSLDVHVGQSYSVLVTADQNVSDYYIVVGPRLLRIWDVSNSGVGVLHYDKSTKSASGPLPYGPYPFDQEFSINQAKSIRWNMTAGAARPNPQGTFNVTNVTLSQTFILRGSIAEIDGGVPLYTVNNVSYLTPDTPLKLADHYANESGVYQLDKYPIDAPMNGDPVVGTFVATGNHKGWLEIVLKNDLDVIDTWHLDGFGFFVVGFGDGEWSSKLRSTYNLFDPVVRSTVQVYSGRWTAVYVYLDNPGMWNLRSQHLRNWYLGQELYVRVYDADPNPAKERPPPDNLLLCGKFAPPPPESAPPPPSGAPNPQITWLHVIVMSILVLLQI